MAKLSKEAFLKLWGKFQSDPDSLNVNEYKSLLDSAHALLASEEIEIDFAKEVIQETGKFC